MIMGGKWFLSQLREDGFMDDETIRRILSESRTIAVVGLSPKEDRPSHRVASYLISQGFRVIPIHPKATEILGQRAYPFLEDVPDDIKIDVVDVFRKPQETPPIARQAVKRGAKVLWLQEGIVNEEAAKIASEGGLLVVMDRCMLKEHKRLI
jgi:hypothetical protein